MGSCGAAFLAAFLFVGAPTAYASSENAKAFAIAKQNACLGCHGINRKIIEPSLHDSAAKYKNSPSANTLLKNKIQKGGAGC
jgi:cytochrome c